MRCHTVEILKRAVKMGRGKTSLARELFQGQGFAEGILNHDAGALRAPEEFLSCRSSRDRYRGEHPRRDVPEAQQFYGDMMKLVFERERTASSLPHLAHAVERPSDAGFCRWLNRLDEVRWERAVERTVH